MFFIVLIKTNKGVFILAQSEKGNAVQAFKRREEALGYFEDAYNDKHSSGYEGSMSACINWMFYQPSVVEVVGLEDIKTIAAEEPRLFHLQNSSGSMTGIDTREVAKELWENGVKPKLIRDKESV